MDSSELIELFYNRTYEKFVNKQILDDKNYIVPRQQLSNYVHELVNIPFVEFIEYIKEEDIERIIEFSDITQFNSFLNCELGMCNALIWSNNPGCKYIDIGRLFPNNIISKSDAAYRRYGERHVKAARQLGLTFEYYNYWYLSCLGYIYPDLEENVRMQLLARTITRNRLYKQMLIDIMSHDLKPEVYMNILSERNMKKCIISVNSFFDICLAECKNENITTYKILIPKESNQNTIVAKNSLDTYQNLHKYLEEFKYRRLSRDTTNDLIIRYRNGDLKAYETLVKGYMKLVVFFAKAYSNKGVGLDDLIQEGVLGLINAFNNYNLNSYFGFSRYASFLIKQAIAQALINVPQIVRVPLNVIRLQKEVWRYIEEYEQKNEYSPSADKIEEEMLLDKETTKYFCSVPNEHEKLTCFKDNWDESPSNLFFADELVMKESRDYVLEKFLYSLLGERDCNIIKSIYGIDNNEQTLSSIADYYGYTRERVRQISVKAIKRLKDSESLRKHFYSDLPKNCRISVDDNYNEKMESLSKTIGATSIIKEILQEKSQPEKKVKQFKLITVSISINSTKQELTSNIEAPLMFSSENDNLIDVDGKKSEELENTIIINANQDVINTKVNDIIQTKTNGQHQDFFEPHDPPKKYADFGLAIENKGNSCAIYNSEERKVYSSRGRIIRIKLSLFRLNYTYSYFSVYIIIRNDKGIFTTGNRIIHAEFRSQLYHIVDYNNFINNIMDIGGDNYGNYYIKVDGKWYDQIGNKSSLIDSDITSHPMVFTKLSVSYKIDNNQAFHMPKTKKYSTVKYRCKTKEKKSTQKSFVRLPNQICNPSVRILKEAMVGDKIVYDSRNCAVIEKKIINSSFYLIVKYDDGTIDSVHNDWNRYIVL